MLPNFQNFNSFFIGVLAGVSLDHQPLTKKDIIDIANIFSVSFPSMFELINILLTHQITFYRAMYCTHPARTFFSVRVGNKNIGETLHFWGISRFYWDFYWP